MGKYLSYERYLQRRVEQRNSPEDTPKIDRGNPRRDICSVGCQMSCRAKNSKCEEARKLEMKPTTPHRAAEREQQDVRR